VRSSVKAADNFQGDMNSLLQNEHWKRIEALTRRFAKQWDGHYKHIQPVASLIEQIKERLAVFWATPKVWKPADCSQEMKDASIVLGRRRNQLGRVFHRKTRQPRRDGKEWEWPGTAKRQGECRVVDSFALLQN
jgi:hypothetical protein